MTTQPNNTQTETNYPIEPYNPYELNDIRYELNNIINHDKSTVFTIVLSQSGFIYNIFEFDNETKLMKSIVHGIFNDYYEMCVWILNHRADVKNIDLIIIKKMNGANNTKHSAICHLMCMFTMGNLKYVIVDHDFAFYGSSNCKNVSSRRKTEMNRFRNEMSSKIDFDYYLRGITDENIKYFIIDALNVSVFFLSRQSQFEFVRSSFSYKNFNGDCFNLVQKSNIAPDEIKFSN